MNYSFSVGLERSTKYLKSIRVTFKFRNVEIKLYGGNVMWSLYSVSLIFSYGFTRHVTERFNFHLRFGKFWIHHWILGALAMIVCLAIRIEHPVVWGALTGIALEGIGRKNWSLLRKTTS